MASKVRYDADTGKFVSEVGKATTALRASSSALKEAQAAAKESFRQQSLEAKATGASTEKLQQIQQKYFADLLAIRTTQQKVSSELMAGNQAGVTSEEAKQKAIARTKELLQQEAEAIRVRNAELAKESGHYTPTRVQRNGALIRGGGVRAAELSASLLPGFDMIAGAAFPILGLGTLTMELVHAGEAFAEMRRSASRAAEEMGRDFAESNSKVRSNIDETLLAAAKARVEFDRLTGHPGRNGMAVALYEGIVAADKLRDSIAADRKELEELFKAHTISGFQSALFGVEGNKKQGEEVKLDSEKVEKEIDKINGDYARAVQQTPDEQARKSLAATRDARTRAVLQERVKAYLDEADRLRKEQAASEALAEASADRFQSGEGGSTRAIDNSLKISGVEGAAGVYQRRIDMMDATQTLNRDSEAAASAKADKEKRLAAVEAARSAQEKQRQQWEDEHAEWEAATRRTAIDERTFWVTKAMELDDGSKNYSFAMRKANEALKKIREERDQLWEANRKVSQDAFKSVAGIVMTGVDSQIKGQLDFQRSLQEQARAQREIAYNAAMANVQYDEQMGRISRGDAARARQSINQIKYDQQRADLLEKIAALQDGPQKAADETRLQTQLKELDAGHLIQSLQDAASVARTDLAGALKEANAQWVQDSTDSAAEVVNLYRSTLSSINGGIVNSMFGQGNWAQTWMGIGKNVAGAGLQRIEGGVMNALGMGKADGSKTNPYYVRSADSIPAGGSWGGMGGIMSMIPGGSILSGFFGGGRAIGGGVDAGMTYLVGERGPELVTMGGNGNITPNHRIGDVLGSGDSHFYDITVPNGITPEQFHQSMASLIPGIVMRARRGAVEDVRAMQQRRPLSVRG